MPMRLAVAPMMAWTDRHCRALHRILAPDAWVFTEMVVANALRHGPRDRLLRYDASEHPVAIQLGGNDPEMLAWASRLAAEHGYDAINLNVGCPSGRVQNGTFGACLMREPRLVAECLRAMREAVSIPVSIKTRLGLEDCDTYDFLSGFVDAVRASGVTQFIMHARIAILDGLTPAQNRDVPPLQPDRVKRLKQDFPELTVIVNGGIDTTAMVEQSMRWADGVMIGRAAYHNPMWLAELQELLFSKRIHTVDAPLRALQAFEPYIGRELDRGTRLHDITRHMLGLFAGMPGARKFRRHLSEHARSPGAGLDVLRDACAHIETATRHRAGVYA